jgi:uncharacterized membrane protein
MLPPPSPLPIGLPRIISHTDVRRWLGRVCLWSALVAGIVLATGSLACGGGCEALGQTAASRFLGQPVAWWGLGAYVGLLIVEMMPVRGLWKQLGFGLACGAAFWFCWQMRSLQIVCGWCLLAHVGAILAAVLLAFGPWLIVGATLAVVILIFQPQEQARYAEGLWRSQGSEVSLLAGKYTLPEASLPRFGHGQKSFAVVTNAACPHCQRLLRDLPGLLRDYGQEQFAAYLLPVASSLQQAEASALLLAVWQTDPNVYREIGLEAERDVAALQQRLEQGGLLQRVREILPVCREQMALHGKMVEENGLRSYPQLWFPSGAVVGIRSQAHLYQVLEEKLGLKRDAEIKLEASLGDLTLGICPAGGRQKRLLELKNAGQVELLVKSISLPQEWALEAVFPLKLGSGDHFSAAVTLVAPKQPLPDWRPVVTLDGNFAAAPKLSFSGSVVEPVSGLPPRWELPDLAEGVLLTPQVLPGRIHPAFQSVKGAVDVGALTLTRAGDTWSLSSASPLPRDGLLGVITLAGEWGGWDNVTVRLPFRQLVRSSVRVTPRRIVLLKDAAWDRKFTIAVRHAGKEAPQVELSPAAAEAGMTYSLQNTATGHEVTADFTKTPQPQALLGQWLRLHIPGAAPVELPIVTQ